MAKKLLGNSVVQYLIGRAIGGYMLFVGATTRWTLVNRSVVEPFWRPDGGKLIGCIWHGRFPLVHKLWSFKPGVPKAKMLISMSREGGIVAHTAGVVGAEVVRGSAAKGTQRKGGAEALRAMTPDGPRGPRMRAKRAPVQLAKLAGAPILPLTWATSNRHVFRKSWDHFVLPLPFGRGALVWGDLIAPPPPDASDAEIERVRLVLEAEMNRIAAEADRMVGVSPIVPAAALETQDAEPAST